MGLFFFETFLNDYTATITILVVDKIHWPLPVYLWVDSNDLVVSP